MRFADREEAGIRLAAALADAVTGPSVVLGIPRGGVLVAVPVARGLGAPLDIVVPKKVGAPFNPELGLGAVAPGVRVLDEDLISRLGVTPEYLEREIALEEAEIGRRTAAYRRGLPDLKLEGRTAVIVDDGVATGVFAAPVGPPGTAARLGAACDTVLLLHAPHAFAAVGEWYDRFDQVSDDEVRAALAAVAR